MTSRSVPVFLWAAMIFFLSSIPEENLPNVPIPHIGKIVHFVEYSILGMLSFRAFRHSNPKTGRMKQIIIVVILIMLFAISDEWHQTFVPGRDGNVADVIFDTIYSGTGIFLYNKMFIQPSD